MTKVGGEDILVSFGTSLKDFRGRFDNRAKVTCFQHRPFALRNYPIIAGNLEYTFRERIKHLSSMPYGCATDLEIVTIGF